MDVEIYSKVIKYKTYIEKTKDVNKRINEVLIILKKLDKLPIGLDILQETGIGKIINSLRKLSEPLGSFAKSLVLKWKNLVQEAIESEPIVKSSLNVNSLKESTSCINKYDTKHDDKHYDYKDPVKKSLSNDLVRHTSDKTEVTCKNENNASKLIHSLTKEMVIDNNKNKLRYDSSKFENLNNLTELYNSKTLKNDKTKEDVLITDKANGLLSDRNVSILAINKMPKENVIITNTKSNMNLLGSGGSKEITNTHAKNTIHFPSSKADKTYNKYLDSDSNVTISSDLSLDLYVPCYATLPPEFKQFNDTDIDIVNNNKSNISKSKNPENLIINRNNESTSVNIDNKTMKTKATSKKRKRQNSDKSSEDTDTNKSFLSALNIKTTSQTTPNKKKTFSKETKIKEDITTEKDISTEIEKMLTDEYELNDIYAKVREDKNNADKFKNVHDTTSSRKYAARKVYSGRRTKNIFTSVPSLIECCQQVLWDNIDALEDVGLLPYELIEPLLKKCTAVQLENIESFNEHFIPENDLLWKLQVEKYYPNQQPSKKDTWRSIYFKNKEAQKTKLNKFIKNVSANVAKEKEEAHKTKFIDPTMAVGPRKRRGTTAQIVHMNLLHSSFRHSDKGVKTMKSHPPLMQKAMKNMKMFGK